jgi:hypothetical protein
MQVNPAATAYDLIALVNNIVRKLYDAIDDEDEYSMAVRIINEELNETLTALSKNVGLPLKHLHSAKAEAAPTRKSGFDLRPTSASAEQAKTSTHG